MKSESDKLYIVNPQDWQFYMSEISRETDRGTALITAAFLETLLGSLIEELLVRNKTISKKLLKGVQAPLSTFASRILASYSMGLIHEDEYHDLNIIRDIRNDFGHKLEITTFSDKILSEKVKKLVIPSYIPKETIDLSKIGPRKLFTDTSAMLGTFLDKRRRMIKNKYIPAKRFYITLSKKL
jgi:DNA-binding MltR family transcriptional regulator